MVVTWRLGAGVGYEYPRGSYTHVRRRFFSHAYSTNTICLAICQKSRLSGSLKSYAIVFYQDTIRTFSTCALSPQVHLSHVLQPINAWYPSRPTRL